MKDILSRVVAFVLVVIFVASPVWATCGGGGGGGGGGMAGSGGNNGGGANPEVYRVPWKVPDAKALPVRSGMILYWFPASVDEVKISPLRESRDLSLLAKECVTMQLDDKRDANYDKLVGTSALPVVVLANPDATTIGKVENSGGKIKLADVEKLVTNEVKNRKGHVDDTMKDAKTKAAAGDKPGAIALYQNERRHFYTVV